MCGTLESSLLLNPLTQFAAAFNVTFVLAAMGERLNNKGKKPQFWVECFSSIENSIEKQRVKKISLMWERLSNRMINRSHFSHSLLQIRTDFPRANDALAIYQCERGILAFGFCCSLSHANVLGSGRF